LAFYDFPAEHWMHLRTTNPIESVFATVRLRTYRTKGSGSAKACETMVFKLMESASKRWRALNKATLVAAVVAGVKFVNGEQVDAA
jgi:transposase-like protein